MLVDFLEIEANKFAIFMEGYSTIPFQGSRSNRIGTAWVLTLIVMKFITCPTQNHPKKAGTNCKFSTLH